MTCVRRSDYSFMKKLLLVLGFWPTPNSKFRLFRITFFYTVYIGYLLLETTWFYTFECDINCVANVLSIFIQNLMIVFKYFIHHRHMTAVYTLYTAIEFDWKFLRNDKPSIEILRKYAELVNTISISLMILICSGTVVVIFMYQILPVLKIPEENYTRFWQRPFALKALGKAASYSTLYLISMNVFLNYIILAALEITFMAFSEHVCGLLKITSYHLRYDANEYIKGISGCEKNSDVYTKIIFAVRVHIKAMKYVQIIWDMFQMHYTILVLLGIIGATMVFVSIQFSLVQNPCESSKIIFNGTHRKCKGLLVFQGQIIRFVVTGSNRGLKHNVFVYRVLLFRKELKFLRKLIKDGTRHK
ncbi:uncharacterized protein LOC122566842 isoform X2 [Bombus pyrosoma]|uniref:uncharacterized protein LOC122566842 isoform X2 n=1 Tax=Bombus pyrosoma TaxID=396416 RepID=UPI001CB9A7E3|nr:uncharacterized protein LOC122566842 isoform X2 [Bombus pyrosoma]